MALRRTLSFIRKLKQANMTLQQKIGFANLMILSGLLYTKLALIYHVVFTGEPSIKFAFNIFTGVTGIAIGLIAKFINYQRQKAVARN
jgi:hypothetical protein